MECEAGRGQCATPAGSTCRTRTLQPQSPVRVLRKHSGRAMRQLPSPSHLSSFPRCDQEPSYLRPSTFFRTSKAESPQRVAQGLLIGAGESSWRRDHPCPRNLESSGRTWAHQDRNPPQSVVRMPLCPTISIASSASIKAHLNSAIMGIAQAAKPSTHQNRRTEQARPLTPSCLFRVCRMPWVTSRMESTVP